MLVGARATFCAGHRLPQHADIHGHSYEVWAYAKVYFNRVSDVEKLQAELTAVCKTIDHRMLNDVIEDPTMENIAKYFVGRMPEVYRIKILRPVEGLSCEWTDTSVASENSA